MNAENPQERPPDLDTLARARFGGLSQAEVRLLAAIPNGQFAVCGPNMSDADPANDPANSGTWASDRDIRADLIRWLCVDRIARELVDPMGIQAYGARMPGAIDLSGVTVPFGLALRRCRLMDRASLYSAEIPALDLQGTWLHSLFADTVTVKGNVLLRSGFHTEGEVRLLGARIGGNLDCSNAALVNPPRPNVSGTGIALNADGIDVTGNIFLNRNFRAEGQVRLVAARIGMTLDCSNGAVENHAQADVPGSGIALNADRVVVKGTVFLNNGFRATGEVRLLGGQVEGQLACTGGSIDGALTAEAATVKRGLFWTDVVNPERTTLNLKDASVGALFDDIKSWPPPGNLFLDGFLYERISSGPRDARNRLEWLARQRPFTPQPYRRLAKVLRDEGDDVGARLVLFEMEKRRRQQKDRGQLARVWTGILKLTIGFGYYPGRALLWSIGLTVVGCLLFWGGYTVGSMAPTDKDAYGTFRLRGQLPPQYERFNALIYSFEGSVPLIKLGQVDRWQPDPNPRWECQPAISAYQPLCRVVSPTSLRSFRWIQTCLGWFFATMGVAGVTGIIRKE